MMDEEIGMQIRILDSQQHTRPYKQYYAYHRDVFPYFFGLPQALPHVYETGYLIVVEGIFDYFAVRRVTPNVMAVLTSGVPVACRRFFRRFCRRVVAMLDMDSPGREGADQLAHNSSAEGYHVIIPTYSEKDPGELLKKGKIKEIERIVSSTSKLLLP
jgi:DNA primase